MKILKVTTVSFTELLLISTKSRFVYIMTPVKQLIDDFNSNKERSV